MIKMKSTLSCRSKLPVRNLIKSLIKTFIRRIMRNNLQIMKQIKMQMATRILIQHRLMIMSHQVKVKDHQYHKQHLINQHFAQTMTRQTKRQGVHHLNDRKYSNQKRLKVLLLEDFHHCQMQMKKLVLGILANHLILKKLQVRLVIQT